MCNTWILDWNNDNEVCENSYLCIRGLFEIDVFLSLPWFLDVTEGNLMSDRFEDKLFSISDRLKVN